MRIVIAGAGIGGLTAALSLHAAGFTDVTVLEAARKIQQLGVGINLPPHAVRELDELGLGEGVASFGIPTAELAYIDSAGQLINAEARGLDAGYRWPQYSVHRGKLQELLLNAVIDRLGAGAVHTGRRVQHVIQENGTVRIAAVDPEGVPSAYEADVLVGADGIRSAVRTALYQGGQPLATNGWTMFRGAGPGPAFRGGRSMVIVGDEHLRCVVYPIGPGILNWLIVRPTEGATGELGNWNRPISPEVVAKYVEHWDFEWLDIPALVRRTEAAYEYPMADIDPLPRWTFGAATLLGDAAHAMYPFGSNGASQAIIDARVLAYHLATQPSAEAALAAYERDRREAVAAVQQANRTMAGDVMKRVSDLARARDHASAAAELARVEQRYRQLAGFDVKTLNERPSWSVTRA
ncbi:FAD-dependent monooxygenase [Pigmentiphaga sp.]|jgi:2-polyprenyl-6-methoxyphenol hydroxylase and related FAD-dependent oxidoreductases|uniref:FAD-dependent monooxygenase n=1 Tax=Pigmentiphaga sp. TaxID=1977564 RepID=UPI0025E713BA|nr:FAD-dependent monooxygenase [Pigmentiphaga sp.]MBX6318277.1 FAD-dependent monooxygenase [Pigmentiphaga sp.]